MKRAAPLIPLALAAACAPTPRGAEQAAAATAQAQEALARELAGLTPGRPQTCLNETGRAPINTEAFGDTLVFEASSAVKYRNDTAGGCAGLARGDVLVTQTPSGRLCRGDIAQTVDPVSRFPTGSCALGEFTPYTRP